MKDATHHLKHVQKKVIQSLRKEEALLESERNNKVNSSVNNQFSGAKPPSRVITQQP